MSDSNGTCPTCRQGDLIAISMTVGDRDLRFTTCHLCEAKWWFQEGELVPLTSILFRPFVSSTVSVACAFAPLTGLPTTGTSLM